MFHKACGGGGGGGGGGGEFLCVEYCHLPFSSLHTCERACALLSVPGK